MGRHSSGADRAGNEWNGNDRSGGAVPPRAQTSSDRGRSNDARSGSDDDFGFEHRTPAQIAELCAALPVPLVLITYAATEGTIRAALEAIAAELSGLDLRPFFDAALRGTEVSGVVIEGEHGMGKSRIAARVLYPIGVLPAADPELHGGADIGPARGGAAGQL